MRGRIWRTISNVRSWRSTPPDFDPETTEEIAEAEAFVICWDLGIRSGADLVEEIRADEGLADRVVIVALAAPTRARVRWALAVGADAVCVRPYAADEMRARLDAVAARRPPDQAA